MISIWTMLKFCRLVKHLFKTKWKDEMSRTNLHLRYPSLKIGFVIRVISDISGLQRTTTLTITDSTGDPVSMESEIARVVSLSTTEISEITRLKIRSSRVRKP